MKIETGLLDSQVLQRTRAGVCDTEFAGTCSGSGGGGVFVTVTKGGKPLAGFRGRRVGSASGGRFRGRLKGLSAGGPYEVELSIRNGKEAAEEITVPDVLVGDVWLLGGQSNMQGCGLLGDLPRARRDVRAFYMDDRWAPAQDPIHNLWEAVDQVHADLNGGVRPGMPEGRGAGPGAAFAGRMRDLSGVPQGLLACAHGGSSMTQWDPALRKLGDRSLYGAMLRRFRKNGSRVAGLLWYQGCSDASPEASGLYTKRMKAFIAAVRRDFGDPNLPVVVVQISRVTAWGGDGARHWNSVQDQQRRLSEVVRNCAVVPAIDLALDDGIHIEGRDQNRLGRRLAYAMNVLRTGRRAGLPPIRLKKVSVVQYHGAGSVVAEFDRVAGALRSLSRPYGFAIVDRTGTPYVFDTKVEGRKVIVRSSLGVQDLRGMSLHYGFGIDPYCNITDEADRSLPVFGPIPIGLPVALTPYVRTVRISRFQPAPEKLHGLKYPRQFGRLGLERRVFTQDFLDRHEEFARSGPGEKVSFHVCRFRCRDKMQLETQVGYDGPVKVWLDGKEVFHDPNGTNPAVAGAARLALQPGRGEHDLVVALGSNGGKAWGIYLRFERKDVPARLLKKGPEHYAMPELLD
ncbi:MAG: hypothetical protein NTV86_17825 [Planctomycetota bacterium]|nr:hypothetical protein [Planctomycetota bacterium]